MFPSHNQKSGVKNKDVKKESEAENKFLHDASNENIVNSILNIGNETDGQLRPGADESGETLFGSLNEVFTKQKKLRLKKI